MTNRKPPASPDRNVQGHAGRVYSSYTVRIWGHPGASTYDRAEVHHLQTGKVMVARRVNSEWIRKAIDQGQQPEDSGTGTGGTA